MHLIRCYVKMTHDLKKKETSLWENWLGSSKHKNYSLYMEIYSESLKTCLKRKTINSFKFPFASDVAILFSELRDIHLQQRTEGVVTK